MPDTAIALTGFVSREGAQILSELRTGGPFAATGKAPIVLLAQVPSEDCGCPEEIWRINGLICVIHLEADGKSEMFIFFGEGEHTVLCDAASIDELRAKMFFQLAQMKDESDA